MVDDAALHAGIPQPVHCAGAIGRAFNGMHVSRPSAAGQCKSGKPLARKYRVSRRPLTPKKPEFRKIVTDDPWLTPGYQPPCTSG